MKDNTIENNVIETVRGDTQYLSVFVFDEKDKPVTILETDIIIFTVKTSPFYEEILIQKELDNFDENKATFKLIPSDTIGLKFGGYVYDIELRRDEDIFTIIECPEKGYNFFVKKEVTTP